MKAISVAGIILLLYPNIYTYYKVQAGHYAELSIADGKDSSTSVATSENLLRLPDDDPNLQNALQKVMREMNKKLNRTPYEGNRDGMKTTKKMKLFFITPSPYDSATSDAFEEAELRYHATSMSNRQIRGRNLDNSLTEEINTQKPTYSYNQSDFPVSNSTLGPLNHFKDNYTGLLLQNSSHTPFNEKVEMKVELTINLSENDQHEHYHSVNHSIYNTKNTSLNSDDTYVSAKPEELDSTMVKSIQKSKDRDSLLNIATENLNLKIKLAPHNHTDATHFMGSNNNASEKIKFLEMQGGARSLNVLDSMKSDEAPGLLKNAGNSTHKAKKDVYETEYISIDSKNLETSRNFTKPSYMKTNTEASEEQLYEKTIPNSPMDTQSSAKDPSKTESTSLGGSKAEKKENPLLDSLKTIIQNLTKFYANQDGNYFQDGENLIRNISKFLPGSVGIPKEQNYLEQLRQYLLQPNLTNQIGFPKMETFTDLETFLKVLKKLSRSKKVRESDYYPIISEYLNFYESIRLGTQGDGSEDKPWSYESSLTIPLLDYIFDDYSADRTKSGGKGNLKFHRSESSDSSGSESDEWDVL